MFPWGEDGYHFELQQINPNTGFETNKRISCMDFYSYQLMVRQAENHLLCYRRLLQQFLVDMYAKIESERLLFIQLNQKNYVVKSIFTCEMQLMQIVASKILVRW